MYQGPGQVLGSTLGTLRYRTKLSQKRVAILVGVSVVSVRNWENGQPKPTLENLKKLCAVYLEYGAFPPDVKEEEIKEEIKSLWSIVDDRIAFDEVWFVSLLHQYRSQKKDDTEQGLTPQQHENVPAHIHEVKTNLERMRMLKNVRSAWIDGVLEKSIRNGVAVTIELREQPDAVADPLGSPLHAVYHSEHLPFTTTSIWKMYKNAHEKLLILGEPGSGKTSLLLELTRILLDEADSDSNHPIPIIFNLASWTKKRQSLTKWLVEELNTKYQVPCTLGQSWIEQNQLLPLLDGFDEVSSVWRLACVDAINSYLGDHGLVPIVICSRSGDYLDLHRPFLLRNAAMIQPLTEQSVDDYLVKMGKQMEGLRRTLRGDLELQKLTVNPLMLLILTAVYENRSIENAQTNSSLDLRRHIFATYLTRTLQKHSANSHYKTQQILHWLQWLAWQLKWRDQSDFYIEFLQFSWLSENRLRCLYPGFSVAIIYGLLSAIGYGISYLPYFSLSRVIVFVLCIALFNTFLYGFFNGIIFGLLADVYAKPQNAIPVQAPKTEVIQKVIALLKNRMVYGVLNGVFDGVFVGFLVGPVSGWICGLFSCAFCAALGKLDSEIKYADYLSWSWESMFRNASKFLLGGLGVGLLYGLVTGRSYLFTPAKLLPSLFLGLGIGLVVGLVMSIRGGFTNKMPVTYQTLKPNQGIRNSIKYSLLFGLFFGLAFGLLFGLIYGPALFVILGEEYRNSFPANSGLIYGLSDGFIVAGFFWLLSGGCACIQHLVLRFILFCNGKVPWNYPHFLDYASDCALLRRVGGGYIFTHSLLRDYIATLNTELDSEKQKRLS